VEVYTAVIARGDLSSTAEYYMRRLHIITVDPPRPVRHHVLRIPLMCAGRRRVWLLKGRRRDLEASTGPIKFYIILLSYNIDTDESLVFVSRALAVITRGIVIIQYYYFVGINYCCCCCYYYY